MFPLHTALNRLAQNPRVEVAGITLLALVVRLPALLADRHLTFDDGVYGSAALSMRHGNLPFQDVYSPQGPAHLATVWFFDVLGGQSTWSPRISSVVVGLAITVGVWSYVRSVCDLHTARWSAVAVAISGSVGWVTAPLAGDGIAIGWSVAALAIAARAKGRLGYIAIAGIAMGMAVSTKVLVAPVLLMIIAALRPTADTRRNRGTQWLTFGAPAACVVGVWFAAFNPSLVWEQSVRYHASTPRVMSIGDNVATLFNTATHRDPLIVVVLVVGLVAGYRLRSAFPPERRGLLATSAAWLLMTAALLIAQKAMFRAHVSNLVVPAIVFCAFLNCYARPSTRPRVGRSMHTIALTFVAVGFIFVQFGGLLMPGGYSNDEKSAISTLRTLPRDALVVTDEPGLAWRSQHEMPSWLIDPGIKRFFGDDLKVGHRSVYAAIKDTRVCAVVVWTFRYGSKLPGLADDLELNGFARSGNYGLWTAPDESRGPRQVWMRQGCASLSHS